MSCPSSGIDSLFDGSVAKGEGRCCLYLLVSMKVCYK